MKRDPSWDKKPFGGGTAKSAEPGSGGGSSGAPIPGGNVARADKLPKAGPGV